MRRPQSSAATATAKPQGAHSANGRDFSSYRGGAAGASAVVTL